MARFAVLALLSVKGTSVEEASGVWSTAETILDAYNFKGTQSSCDPPYNFSPESFVRSQDTIYICSASGAQELIAPLVVGLLDSIVAATYAEYRSGRLDPAFPVSFVLDEAANIAPLPSLARLASEGGGQGLLVAAFFQDFSQPKKLWGDEAKGFWTLFGEKIVLPGISDEESTEQISKLTGSYDRPMVSTTETHGGSGLNRNDSDSVTRSTVRQRILEESEVRAGPGNGMAWHMANYVKPHSVEAVHLAHWWWAPPWPAVLVSACEQYEGPELPLPRLRATDIGPTLWERYEAVRGRRRIGGDAPPLLGETS